MTNESKVWLPQQDFGEDIISVQAPFDESVTIPEVGEKLRSENLPVEVARHMHSRVEWMDWMMRGWIEKTAIDEAARQDLNEHEAKRHMRTHAIKPTDLLEKNLGKSSSFLEEALAKGLTRLFNPKEGPTVQPRSIIISNEEIHFNTLPYVLTHGRGHPVLMTDGDRQLFRIRHSLVYPIGIEGVYFANFAFPKWIPWDSPQHNSLLEDAQLKGAMRFYMLPTMAPQKGAQGRYHGAQYLYSLDIEFDEDSQETISQYALANKRTERQAFFNWYSSRLNAYSQEVSVPFGGIAK